MRACDLHAFFHVYKDQFGVKSQEAQERARWQAAAYSQVQHQHSEDAQEALQHYVEATHLLKQLCQASVPNANDSHEQGLFWVPVTASTCTA